MNETEVVYTPAGCWAANIYRTSLAEPGAAPTHQIVAISRS